MRTVRVFLENMKVEVDVIVRHITDVRVRNLNILLLILMGVRLFTGRRCLQRGWPGAYYLGYILKYTRYIYFVVMAEYALFTWAWNHVSRLPVYNIFLLMFLVRDPQIIHGLVWVRIDCVLIWKAHIEIHVVVFDQCFFWSSCSHSAIPFGLWNVGLNGSFLVQERSWMEVMALLRVINIINIRHVSLHWRK